MYDLEFSDPTMTTLALLRQTWIIVNRAIETRLGRIGLTPEKFAVIWICRDHPGPLTPAEISRLMDREPQSITGVLNRLEREGLVKRIVKRKGRPFTEIKLTAKGENLCAPGIEICKRLIQGLTSDLPPSEREGFHKTLKVMRQRMLDELHLETAQSPVFHPGKPVPLKW